MTEFDPVSKPEYYANDPSGVECIQITRHRNFNVGNAIKYLWRAGLKDDKNHIQDLQKAMWYINDEIMRLQEHAEYPTRPVSIKAPKDWFKEGDNDE